MCYKTVSKDVSYDAKVVHKHDSGMAQRLIISTTEAISGRTITATLGTVKGNTVRTRHVGSDIAAHLKSVIGGEIKGYVTVLSEAREEAEDRMLQQAEALNADAIVSVRYATSQVMDGAAEILVYGTAVTLGE